VNEKLGYGLEGWKFWWSDRDFCNMLMTGVDSIHTARLFEGRTGSRRKWDGAKQAILEANNEVKILQEILKKEDQGRKHKDI
jgi:dimethylaniline monooxygenase (N-oxide forming)